MRDQ